MIVTTIMMKWDSIKEIVTGAANDTQHQNNAHPKTSPIDCDGVLRNNVQCLMVPISILWYREYWTIQLKCTLETRQEIITVSNHPIRNFIPKITLPTRIKDTSMTLIHHIFLRVPKTDIDKPVYCGNLYSEIKDHLPNFIVWPCGKLLKLQRPLIRIYSE